MQRDEILRKLEDLVPEIQSSKDAEGTLLKFASSNNLSPAQLETLAQVYNTGRALTFYSKSANRGGTFKLVETEPLLDKYTDHLLTSGLKEARFSKAAGVKAVEGTRFPHFRTIVESSEALEKAASVDEIVENWGRTELRRMTESDAATKAAAMADELADAKMDDLRASLSTVRDEIRFNKEAFTRLEEDAHDMWAPGAWKNVFDKAAAYLKTVGCDVDAFRYEEAKKADRAVARDTTGLLGSMASVRDDLDFIKASREFANEFDKLAGKKKKDQGGGQATEEPPAEKPQPTTDLPPGFPIGRDTKIESPGTPKPKPDKPTLGSATRVEPTPGRGKGAPTKGEQVYRHGPSSKIPKSYPQELTESERVEPGSKDKGAPVLDQFLAGMMEAKKFKAPALQEPLNYGKSIITSISDGKNRRQKSRDQAVTEDTSTAALQRLMYTDPILAQADPEDVIQHFNTINELSPAVASDPQKLKLVLQEAVTYGSIPMHTLKELLEINKLLTQNQELARKNESEAYGPSGLFRSSPKPKSV